MEGNRLRLLFGGSRPSEAQRQVVADLVRGRAAEAGGMAFQAIREVVLEEGSIVLEFPPPLEPAWVEVSPGHSVACYLYPQPQA